MTEKLDDNIAIVFERGFVQLEAQRADARVEHDKFVDELDKLSSQELVGLLEYTISDINLFTTALVSVSQLIDQRSANAKSRGDAESSDEVDSFGQAAIEVNRTFMHREREDDRDLSGVNHPEQYATAILQLRNYKTVSHRASLTEDDISDLAQDLTAEEIVAIGSPDFSPNVDADSVRWVMYTVLVMNYFEALKKQDQPEIARYAGALIANGHEKVVGMYEDWKPVQ